MGNLFSKPKPQGPPRVPTDKVVPMYDADDNAVNRAIIMLFMMKFDDVLDPEKLRSSLEKLLNRDGWRKLGARMRLNVSSTKKSKFNGRGGKNHPSLIRPIPTWHKNGTHPIPSILTEPAGKRQARLPHPGAVRREAAGLRVLARAAHGGHRRAPARVAAAAVGDLEAGDGGAGGQVPAADAARGRAAEYCRLLPAG